MVIVDSAEEYVGANRSFYRNPENVVGTIRKLRQLAEQTGCAILLIAQSDGLDCLQSKKWRKTFDSEIASYLCMEKDTEEDDRIMIHEKSLIALEGEPVSYTLKAHRGLTAGFRLIF